MKLDLPLNALRAFASVYEHHGVRAAARELRISHSTLSRHVAELERWIGTPLSDARRGRSGKPFTEQGEALGRVALSGLRDLQRVVDQLREARSQDSVVISTTASIATRWLLPKLDRFERRHPRHELSVLVDQRLVDLDREGIDLAIRMGRGPWPGLDGQPLMDDALYPVASAGYWRSTAGSSRPEALRSMRLLHDRDPSSAWEVWRDAFGPADLDVRRGRRFGSSDLVLRAAAGGHGVALARDRLVAADVADGVLIRPFGNRQVSLPSAYWLIVRTHGRSRSAIAAVIDWLDAEARA